MQNENSSSIIENLFKTFIFYRSYKETSLNNITKENFFIIWNQDYTTQLSGSIEYAYCISAKAPTFTEGPG